MTSAPPPAAGDSSAEGPGREPARPAARAATGSAGALGLAGRAVGGRLRRILNWNLLIEEVIQWLLFLCALISVLTTFSIVYVLFTEAVWAVPPNEAFFQKVSLWNFLTDTRWTPQFQDEHFGILPLVCGTLLITLIAGLVGLPIGLASAIYLSEYASPRVRAILKPTLEILAGIPTVVYGYLALRLLTPYVLKPLFDWLSGGDSSTGWLSLDVPFNALSGGIVVGLMIIPTVSSLSEDVLRAVPRSLREAGFALGSTKYDVCVKIVVPSALSGILASFLLALSRAIGETMAVTLAAGQLPNATLNPLRQIETMTAFIVNVMSGDATVGGVVYKSLYAVALVLFLSTLAMNLMSQLILARYREVYQ